MKKRWMFPLLIGFLPFALGCPDPDPDDPEVTTYEVELAGENQVPAVATPATGMMTVSLDENNILEIDGTFENLVSELRTIQGSSAHIHLGAADESGPIVFNVDVDANGDNRSGTFTLVQQLTTEQVRLFNNNEYYLNIHTNAYPDGELRAQLDENAREFAAIDESWGVELSSQAQPHDVTTDAEGWAWAVLREDNTFVLSGAVQNLTSELVDVNLERGLANDPGTRVFGLDFEERNANGYRFFTEATLNETQLNDLRDGLYFINLITADYPEGDLRGQFDETDGFFRDIWEDIFGDDPDQIEEAPPF